MKIFITGGTGFIGKQLVPILEQHELLCLSHSTRDWVPSQNVQFVSGDLCDPKTYLSKLQKFQPDCCIHLAWHGLPNYSVENNMINLTSSIDLVECLKKVGCKKIFVAGSCWEYGNAKQSVMETDLPVNPNIFASFKISLQMILNSICNECNMDLIWGRIFFVYGPGQRPNSLIPSCYNILKNDADLKIINPLAVNDFVYVSDVARAIRHLIELDNISGIYNIGSGQGNTVWEVVNYVAKALGLSLIYKDMPLSNLGNWANTDSIVECGWKSQVSLEEGVSKTIKTLGAI
jgi:nucleoside-diphosphate-sugar epimerase